MNGMSEQQYYEAYIQKWNKLYREGNSEVSDQVYDEHLDYLKKNFPDSLLLKKGVIEQPKESRKQKLPIPMFSLNKEKTILGLKKWLKLNDISENELLVITPKFDGISLVVNEQGLNAWTRGDGKVGQKSGYHYDRMNKGLFCSGVIFSFGEAIMSKKNFEKYKDEYANPRNMVAGLFNRDITTRSLQDVDYIRYGSINEDLNKIIQLEILNKSNSVKISYLLIKANKITKELFEDLYKKWGEDYQIDGLVIDINNAELRQKLGREENMNPKYARAYKNPEWSSSAIVKVNSVVWNVSKQGKLKPVIQIPPTEVAGVIIENVTGYNAKYIFDNNIAEGSEIKIIRSGDVIPKHIETLSFITENVEDLDDEVVNCPSCGFQTIWDETMTELICLNPQCQEKQISKLVHFFETIGIENFGEPSIIQLYRDDYSSIEGILSISEKQLMDVEGFAYKSTVRLLNQFKNLLEVGVPLSKTLHAIDVMKGIVGEKRIQNILDYLTDEQIFGIIDFDQKLFDKLLNIDGVAEITAKTFIEGMIEFNSIWLETLPIKTSYTFSPKQEVIGSKYKGQRICFTGCRPSDRMKNDILSEGGIIVSGVSTKTTVLVVKDLSEKTLKSSKANKAKELDIEIIELKSF